MITRYSAIPKRLHLVVTGETGKALSFVIERDKAAFFFCVSLVLLAALAGGTWLSVQFFQEKHELAVATVSQAQKLETLQNDFSTQVKQELAVREQEWQRQAAAASALISSLRHEKEEVIRKFSEEQERILCRHEEELAAVTQAGSARTADLLAELERARSDKRQLIENTAGRLDQRNRIIETMMSQIGIEVKVGDKPASNSGGPFLAAALDEKFSEQLLSRSDRYIKTIQALPLGLPTQGKITSGFGARTDPLNNQPAFHAGIDFKGIIGDTVTVTAEGVVKESGFDEGGYGHYVIILHGNGYETLFGHLSNVLVRRGEKISRGDAVGLLGNSGRSTGPHLHYEVHHKGKAVDPEKYLSVAGLSFTVPL